MAGDSLLVMNSLLEKEEVKGKIQMLYIDPPYGIKYGSNFQPFVYWRSKFLEVQRLSVNELHHVKLGAPRPEVFGHCTAHVHHGGVIL